MPDITSIDAADKQGASLRAPRQLLYSIGAGIGGSGLDAVALETLKGAEAGGFLGLAVALDNNQRTIPASRVAELKFHPVRALSFLPRPFYIGAKKQAVDRFTAAKLRTGRFDLLHSWSNDCLQSLREANRLKIPSVLEIPTWHRNKGKRKPNVTMSERNRDAEGFPKNIFNRMLVTRQQVMEEYDRASVILVLSEKARETFRIADLPDEKLFMMHRGVDVEKFTAAPAPPEKFRAVFLGALIKRKGVHLLLKAWKKLALPDAELVLLGGVQPEIEPYLKEFNDPSIKVQGFTRNVVAELQRASVHVFPTELEGSAKATYEAAACGLAQITTREAGDVVVDGETGWIIPPNDLDELMNALSTAYYQRDELARRGAAARKRVVENFTWDHFRARLLVAYDLAFQRQG